MPQRTPTSRPSALGVLLLRSASGRSLQSTLLLGMLGLLALACGPLGDLSGAGTGSVSVLVTDAPSDDFTAVNVAVAKIELLDGPAGDVVIFEGDETFDLLALSNVSELFATNEAVTAGPYPRIRMTLTDLEIVVEHEDGTLESHYPALPDSGQVVLVSRAPFVVTDSEMLTLEIDLDVARSIRETGDADAPFEFRPIIFVRTLEQLWDGKIARLHGIARRLDPDTGSFALCRAHRPWPWHHILRRHAAPDTDLEPQTEAAGELLDPADDERLDRRRPIRRCIPVVMADDGALFDENALPIRLGDLEDGAEVTAAGRIRPTQDHLMFVAGLVLVGARGHFGRLVGRIDSVLNDADQFDLLLRPGQGYVEGSVLAVQLFPTSKLFSRSGMTIEREHIELELKAAATGLVDLSNTGHDVINTPLLIVQLEPDDSDRLDGTITRLDLPSRHLLLEWTNDESCVDVPEHSKILILDPETLETRMAELEELLVGDTAEIYGREGDECFRAHVIVATEVETDADS